MWSGAGLKQCRTLLLEALFHFVVDKSGLGLNSMVLLVRL